MEKKLIDSVNAQLERFGLPKAKDLVGRRFLYESRLLSCEIGSEQTYPAVLVSTITGINGFIDEIHGEDAEVLTVQLSVAATTFGIHDILWLELFFRKEIPTFCLEYRLAVGNLKSDIAGEDGTFILLD